MTDRLAALLVALLPLAAHAQDCTPTETRQAVHLAEVTLTDAVPVRLPVADTGWHLAFEPAPHGWRLRLRDGPDPDTARDLSAVTPPLAASLPNPRDLFGWHFRNAANTGPNTGEVNAPQHLRHFLFTTGATLPAPPDPEDGRGWLRLSGLVPSPPETGAQAVLRAARADICLTWPRGAADADDAPEDREIMGACGLDLARWRLADAPAPRLLGGDFDGDGAHDHAAMVRDAEGDASLAVCRAGTWLDLLAPAPLPAGLLPRIEAWRSLPRDHGPLGYVDAPPWPEAEGDLIALERIEKSLHLVYRAQGTWHAQQVYRLVTGE
jgi:hypothetical protein